MRADVLAGMLPIILCAIAVAALAAIVLYERTRMKRVRQLSDYVRILGKARDAADIPPPPLSNKEGWLSILENDVQSFASHMTMRYASHENEKNRLSALLSDISHQLKTPLTSISVMADLLERDDLPPEKHEECVHNLRTGISRMEFLVRALLRLARLDADAADMKPEDISADELLKRAARPLAVLLDVKDQQINSAELSPTVFHCDPAWTAEALGNILKNAGEHSPNGSAISVASGENPICKWISVTDSGTGITANDRPHIFQRFYRSENATEGSVGIGLSLSLAIMRAQNGDIDVQNERSGGATFVLKFYRK